MNADNKNNHRPVVSIVVVPRQQFGVLSKCIDSIYTNTDVAFEICVVHFGSADLGDFSPDDYSGLKVVRADKYLFPYESKNLALRHIDPDCKWVVFIDNDVRVHEGWLSSLIDAAEEEQAAAAHPLYIFERKGRQVIHMAHGEYRAGQSPGETRPVMGLVSKPLAEAKSLSRRESDFVEFHCWLIRRDALEELDGFDAITIGEHIHHSLQLRAAGHRIVFEPESVVTYYADVDSEPANRDYLRFRWNHRAASKSVEELCNQWPEFTRHWRSKIRAAWEFRSSNEAWYPTVGKAISIAANVKRKVRSEGQR